MPEFVVLKNIAVARTASPFEHFGPEATATAAAHPETSVEVHNIPTQQASILAADPQVAAIAIPMPITLIKPLNVQAAPAGADIWGIAAVKADTSPFTGDGVVVAVLDTGIDKTHPAFAGMQIVEQDFTGTGNGDGHGHGTHTAATIFGRDVGGARVGIARGVNKALIGKVLANNGGGSSEMVFKGIQWALDQGAHVISMSLGFDFPGASQRMHAAGLPEPAAVSSALEAYRSNLRFFDALMQLVKAKAAFQDTAVIVAATGNESNRPTYTIAASLPAAAEGVVSVAALGRVGGQLDVANFSNTMPQIAAPGVDIVSAKAGGGLQTMSGTSMACPHASGVAALWWEALRKSGAVKPSAALVVAKMMAGARTVGLAPGAGPLDRGVGLVTAPQ